MADELRNKHQPVYPTKFIVEFCGVDPFEAHCSFCIAPGTKDEDGDYSFAAYPCDAIKALDERDQARAEIIRLESLISAPRECPTSPDGKHRIPEGDELFDFCPRCGTPLSAGSEE